MPISFRHFTFRTHSIWASLTWKESWMHLSCGKIQMTRQHRNEPYASFIRTITISCHLERSLWLRNASYNGKTLFVCNAIPTVQTYFSVLCVIHALQINSSLLSGAYQVHLYDKYKYLHFKYIQCRLGLLPKHVLPFAIQIGFHFAPEKAPSPSLKKSLCLMCLPLDRNICFFLSVQIGKKRIGTEKVGDKGRKQVVLVEHSAVVLMPRAWLSPHWANTVSVLSWYGLCVRKAR